MIHRIIEGKIREYMFQGKVILLFGARRVGKTTLVKSLAESYPDSIYINCELNQNREILETNNIELIKSFIGQKNLLILDEAQQIRSIGSVLKVLHDEIPDLQIVATGSSSFDLQQQTGEPLTGRSRQFMLFPLSFSELVEAESLFAVHGRIDQLLRFGSYPEIYGKKEDFIREELEEISSNYLYKDILQFENLKKPEVLIDLLRALAYQIGREVSYNELSKTIGVHVQTVKSYIGLLEKCFVIFRLPAYSNNKRNEIGKGQKIYFYDLGIRNAIVRNFIPIGIRDDIGMLWENFVVSERKKLLNYSRVFSNHYFWRNYQQQEIDYLEEFDGKLDAYEIKFGVGKKVKTPAEFAKNYPLTKIKVIDKENYFDFLMKA